MHDLPVPKPFVYFAKKKLPPSLAAIIKIPTKVAPQETYSDLVCSPTDRANIHDLITTMAENGKISLLFNHQNTLKAIGVALEHVHPLKFLGVIFSNPHLKACMGKIFEDYFKRTEFVEGLTPGMMRQLEKGKLVPFLADFAKEVNVPEGQLHPYIQSLNWEGLVRHLIGGTGG
jgi:hypothetical protein